MKKIALIGSLSFCLLAPCAHAQDAGLTVRDLDAQNPKRLTLAELQQLLPGAKMSRLTAAGWQHYWTNEPGGSFVVSASNMNPGISRSQAASTAQGKWHIADDGRYCVLIEWKRNPTEEWCRYILQTSDGYYATKSDQTKAEKVYKLDIRK